ncbi:MAG: hypothetical protein ACMVY4_20070 [Minwuia sp.]|uniref:hypothetical protein n=1 Tax=Minwuia sp. TaxID=2493630 RepID=UPI003A838F3B
MDFHLRAADLNTARQVGPGIELGRCRPQPVRRRLVVGQFGDDVPVDDGDPDVAISGHHEPQALALDQDAVALAEIDIDAAAVQRDPVRRVLVGRRTLTLDGDFHFAGPHRFLDMGLVRDGIGRQQHGALRAGARDQTGHVEGQPCIGEIGEHAGQDGEAEEIAAADRADDRVDPHLRRAGAVGGDRAHQTFSAWVMR